MPQSEIIFSVQESPEGGHQARSLGFSIYTQADSLEDLKTQILVAVSCHFEDAQKPSIIRLHMVKDEGHSGLKLPRDSPYASREEIRDLDRLR